VASKRLGVVPQVDVESGARTWLEAISIQFIVERWAASPLVRSEAEKLGPLRSSMGSTRVVEDENGVDARETTPETQVGVPESAV